MCFCAYNYGQIGLFNFHIYFFVTLCFIKILTIRLLDMWKWLSIFFKKNALGSAYKENYRHLALAEKSEKSVNLNEDLTYYLCGSASLPSLLSFYLNGFSRHSPLKIFTDGKIFVENLGEQSEFKESQIDRISFLTLSDSLDDCLEDYRNLKLILHEIFTKLNIAIR